MIHTSNNLVEIENSYVYTENLYFYLVFTFCNKKS